MRVLAINSSLRGGGQSTTELMISWLAGGMKEAGAEVRVINLRKKKVRYCTGCYSCSTRTPGRCVIKDDMTEEIYPGFLKSDLAVLGTPLFYNTLNAPMKAFIERTWPVCIPYLEQEEDGTWTHPLRHPLPRVVMLAVAGFPDISVFKPLSDYARGLFGERLAAEIYRPGSETLIRSSGKLKEEVKDAVHRAGIQLVTDGNVDDLTLETIARPTGDVDTFREMANCFWKTCINEKVTPRQFDKRGMVPRPDSISSFLAVMGKGISLPEDDSIEAVIGFSFSGEPAGDCHFAISRGAVIAREGRSEATDLLIETPFDAWADIMTGKADAKELFMNGTCRATGDFALMNLFSG